MSVLSSTEFLTLKTLVLHHKEETLHYVFGRFNNIHPLASLALPDVNSVPTGYEISLAKTVIRDAKFHEYNVNYGEPIVNLPIRMISVNTLLMGLHNVQCKDIVKYINNYKN